MFEACMKGSTSTGGVLGVFFSYERLFDSQMTDKKETYLR